MKTALSLAFASCLLASSLAVCNAQQVPSTTTINQNTNSNSLGIPALLLGDYEVISTSSSPEISKYFKVGDVFFADSANSEVVFTYVGINRVSLPKAIIKPYEVPSATPSPTLATPQGKSESVDTYGGHFYSDLTGKRFFLRQYQPEKRIESR